MVPVHLTSEGARHTASKSRAKSQRPSRERHRSRTSWGRGQMAGSVGDPAAFEDDIIQNEHAAESPRHKMRLYPRVVGPTVYSSLERFRAKV